MIQPYRFRQMLRMPPERPQLLEADRAHTLLGAGCAAGPSPPLAAFQPWAVGRGPWRAPTLSCDPPCWSAIFQVGDSTATC